MGKVVFLDPTNEFLLSSQQEAQQMKLYQKGRNLYWSGEREGGDLDNQIELKEVFRKGEGKVKEWINRARQMAKGKRM